VSQTQLWIYYFIYKV